MYKSIDDNQISLDEFFLPFGGNLDERNRWVKLSKLMPWSYIDEVYGRSFDDTMGRTAISSRIAFGSIYIKEQEKLTDKGCVSFIQENPYAQYFLGLNRFYSEPLFDSSMMVHFRKRFPAEEVNRINEYICLGRWPDEDKNDDKNDKGSGDSEKNGKPNPNTSKKKLKNLKKAQQNKGKLLMDATVAPSDIRYPTDISILNQSREIIEKAVDCVWKHAKHHGHKLPYSKKKARKSYLNIAKSKKPRQRAIQSAIKDQLGYIESGILQLHRLMANTPHVELPNWIEDRLEVIAKAYDQQRRMYENKQNSCPDRIVSLHQPHVRPIPRGKKPNPTEFGQKLHLSLVDGNMFIEEASFDAFNEGAQLKILAERYKQRFGYYPEAILADRIYQSRENRAYCKEKGIRLSGPPLGRRKKENEKKLQQQIYKDACERNAVEGATGNVKRCIGLDLIMCVLEATSKTEAVLIILAKNALRRILRKFMNMFHIKVFTALFGY